MVIQTTLPQVPLARLELARSYEHSGLNRARLPFHHSGKVARMGFEPIISRAENAESLP
jgi:hypothetical protein